jgi:threonine synthase
MLCGSTADSDALFTGCAVCGVAAPLELKYEPSARAGLGIGAAVREARRVYSPLAPIRDGATAKPMTPLLGAPRFGPGVSLKNEAVSLTGSHKDRYHTVAANVARLLGAKGVVASSTGNHGVSAAAHAAAVGLPTVVFCHAEAPAGLLRAIGAFGGVAAQLPPDEQEAALRALVGEGWFPATSMDPVLSGASNPFGGEGYKVVAQEIVTQLGAMPKTVFVPTAGGDTYYGMLKGFAELAELTGSPMPVVFAIQPEGANSFSRSVAAGEQITLERPASIALSLSDPRTGRHAMIARERWGGQVVDVSEGGIRRAIADLARMGIYPDPASAAALAGYRRALQTGSVEPGATAVLLLTSSGFKWPDAMAEVFPATTVRSTRELERWLAGREARPVGVGSE